MNECINQKKTDERMYKKRKKEKERKRKEEGKKKERNEWNIWALNTVFAKQNSVSDMFDASKILKYK